jgi:hypothetical protein
MHASLGDELTDPSSVAKLPDAAQVSLFSVLFIEGRLVRVFTLFALHVSLIFSRANADATSRSAQATGTARRPSLARLSADEYDHKGFQVIYLIASKQ